MALLLMLIVLMPFVSVPCNSAGFSSDYKIFGGDMRLSLDVPSILNEYAIVAAPDSRWPDGKIPYSIDSSVDFLLDNISLAMQNFMDNTCIQFVPWTGDYPVLMIGNFSSRACFSDVALTQFAPNYRKLNLGLSDCHGVSTIVHLLGHVVGFYHEQYRSDRDDYITYFPQFIADGHEKDLTYKFPTLQDRYLTPFDVDSIMMPSMNQFSKNQLYNTMTSKNRTPWQSTEAKKGLSQSDIDRINAVYTC